MNLFNDDDKQLIPTIIQHTHTHQVLMLGYMNEEAYQKTLQIGKVTFFSRSKQRLWTKGETSENYLWVDEIMEDCDKDTLLVKANPAGPTCHTGSTTCFSEETAKGFLYELEQTISDRIDNSVDGSYTNALYEEGIDRIAQKVGEEAIELVIAAKNEDVNPFKDETADLLYHLLVLLKARGLSYKDIEEVLKERSE